MKIKDNIGFTLIEMLVVILIIGILAGVAIPKYEKIKYKAETRKMLVPLKAIMEAQRRFYIANNKQYAENLDDLEVNISGFTGACKLSYSGLSYCRSNGNVSLYYQPAYNSLGVLFNTGKYKNSGFIWHTYNNYIECYDFGKISMCSELFNCTLVKGVLGEGDCLYRCKDL